MSLSRTQITDAGLAHLKGLSKLESLNLDGTLGPEAGAYEGQAVLQTAPEPLQEQFSARFSKLETWEQHQLVASLERIANMMDAEELDAAPLLATGEKVD